MSHLPLQRVIVRMLWDPEFADRVRTQTDVALAGEDLSPEEISWLQKPDARAWRTDPQRRARTLHGLLEEFPASGLLAARHPRGLHFLDRFFSSTTFHACIRDSASLAVAFGAYLAREVSAFVDDPRVRILSGIEGEVAAFRRTPPRPAASIALSPSAKLIAAPKGGVALLETVVARAAKNSAGAAAIIALGSPGFGDFPPAPKLASSATALIRLDAAGAATVEELPDALAALLRFAESPRTRDALLAEARRQGADPGEDTELLDSLLSDGTLI